MSSSDQHKVVEGVERVKENSKGEREMTKKVEENGSPKDEVSPYKSKLPFPSVVYTKAQKCIFRTQEGYGKHQSFSSWIT